MESEYNERKERVAGRGGGGVNMFLPVDSGSSSMINELPQLQFIQIATDCTSRKLTPSLISIAERGGRGE